MHRSEAPGSASEDVPPLPRDVAFDEAQDLGDGVGPLMHRAYVVRLRESPRARPSSSPRTRAAQPRLAA